jgi:hypothetical protein
MNIRHLDVRLSEKSAGHLRSTVLDHQVGETKISLRAMSAEAYFIETNLIGSQAAWGQAVIFFGPGIP